LIHHTPFLLLLLLLLSIPSFLFFPPPPPTDIYTLSLHDALPICMSQNDWSSSRSPQSSTGSSTAPSGSRGSTVATTPSSSSRRQDRKSTRLNSSHVSISYAVFCLKKKKTNYKHVADKITKERESH